MVALDDGAEVAVFADESDAKVLQKAMDRSAGQFFTCLVRTLHDGGKEITGQATPPYNWVEGDLGPVPEAASRATGAPRRILTRYVDP